MAIELKDGWEERYADIQKLSVTVTIEIEGLSSVLKNADEFVRADHVLGLVKEGIVGDVQNMLKGVVKYVDGHHSLVEWLELLVDESTDTKNYAKLALDEYHRDKEANYKSAQEAVRYAHPNRFIVGEKSGR